jgi:hypothetical protein
MGLGGGPERQRRSAGAPVFPTISMNRPPPKRAVGLLSKWPLSASVWMGTAKRLIAQREG